MPPPPHHAPRVLPPPQQTPYPQALPELDNGELIRALLEGLFKSNSGGGPQTPYGGDIALPAGNAGTPPAPLGSALLSGLGGGAGGNAGRRLFDSQGF